MRSSIWVPREKVGLFWDRDASFAAMPADQHLNHVRYAPVLTSRGLAHSFLDAGLDAQVQRGCISIKTKM
jgi:hypothetical protein